MIWTEDDLGVLLPEEKPLGLADFVLANIEGAHRMAMTGRPIGDGHLDALFDQNPENVYYRFLYYLAKDLQPSVIAELGVCEGRSTAHLAAGCPDAKVIAVDPEVHGALAGNALERYDNIKFWQCRSDNPEVLDSVKDRTVGLLFVDSIHNLPHVLTEMRLWLPKMQPRAPIIFDDLDYHWSMPFLLPALPLEEKGRLEGLHKHGFGYALADPRVRLETERTAHDELTVTWTGANGERQSRTTKG